MPTYTKIPLSASSFGKSIVVTQTGISGTLLHQTPTSTGTIDEVWLYATNPTALDCLLTTRFGGSGISGDASTLNVEAYAGHTLIIPGFVLQGDGSNASNIYGSVPSGYQSGVNIYGYVNRILP